MSEDKELVEVWRKEFICLMGPKMNYTIENGLFKDLSTRPYWDGFLIAKRAQQSVVLPRLINFNDASVSGIERVIYNNLLLSLAKQFETAGIKYTIGE